MRAFHLVMLRCIFLRDWSQHPCLIPLAAGRYVLVIFLKLM